VGLEFGAYQQYLAEYWDGHSDVLFMHDDTIVTDSGAFDQIAALSEKGIHQAYIFNNESEEIANQGKHGRAIWCSATFLKQLKANGGFPYDRDNTGTLTGPKVNAGIEAFARYIAENYYSMLGVDYIAIVPGIQHGRRGKLATESYVYHRSTRQGALLMPGAPNGAIAIHAGNVQ
jgi:hypothetical protein